MKVFRVQQLVNGTWFTDRYYINQDNGKIDVLSAKEGEIFFEKYVSDILYKLEKLIEKIYFEKKYFGFEMMEAKKFINKLKDLSK